MDNSDTVKEVLDTVKFGIQLTMAPLVGQEIFESAQIMQEIIDKNIACFVVKIGDKLDKHIHMPPNIDFRTK